MKKYYTSLKDDLKLHFKENIYKIALDTNTTCPTRNGTKGTTGCFYCSDLGSYYVKKQNLSIKEQIKRGKISLQKRYKAQKFLAYFQSYTPTYLDPKILQNQYEEALSDPDIVGLCVCTRPDCLSNEILQILAKAMLGHYHWLELGLQTSHNQTLEAIGRGHTYEDFLNTYHKAKKIGFRVSVHLILGLPGETDDMILETISKLIKLNVDGLKFHQLHILKNSVFESWYHQQKIKVYSLEEYQTLIGKILPLIPPKIVIHRLIGEAPSPLLIAPTWSKNKAGALHAIHQYLESLI